MINKINVKTILNKSKSQDNWFLGNYTLNPYAGCSIACIYCYTKGSKYGGDHGTNVAAKINSVPLLKRQLKNAIKRNERGFIILGSAADPYPPEEEQTKITREILRVIKRYHFPLHILTKSSLILRDKDILTDIAAEAVLPAEYEGKLNNGLIISFSFSTVRDDIGGLLEPEASIPSKRLETMKKLSDSGFNTGIINMPVLPFISDSKQDIEAMVLKAKEYGANYVLFSGLTLYGDGPQDCGTVYYNFLEDHFPELISRYDQLFENSSAPTKKYSVELSKRFSEISSKHGVKNSII